MEWDGMEAVRDEQALEAWKVFYSETDGLSLLLFC